MTSTQALEKIRHFLWSRLPQEDLKVFNEAYEVLRKLVVDEIARKKNATETERMDKTHE